MSGDTPGVAAVVVAAGVGERLGAGRCKALVELDGRPLVAHALERLEAAGVFGAIVVVHTPGEAEAFASACREHDVAALVPGGAQRTDSVRHGVDALDPATQRIAIHDAARCLTPSEVIARTVEAVHGDVIAAAPGLPVPDTLKRVVDGRVVATVDRHEVWAVHTPQVVEARALRTALAWAGADVATDDLGLIERAIDAGVVSGQVRVVLGDVRDLKITYPQDLALARDLLRGESADAVAGGVA